MSRFLPESDKKNFTYNTERLFSMYDIKKPIIYRVFFLFWYSVNVRDSGDTLIVSLHINK